MKKLYALGIFVIVLLVAMQTASAQFLEITDLKVKVDGDKESGISNSGGTINKVDPGAKIEIKVKLKNTYPSNAADPEITDIEVTGDIENIDDGDDLEPEEEPDEFDLDDSGDTKSVTIEYKIPLRVDESDFDLELTIEGTNATGATQNDTATFTISIDKEKHLLIFDKAVLAKETTECGKIVDLEVAVFNIGSEDEDDTKLTIKNDELGISFTDIFDLDEGGEDDDTEFRKNYALNIPKDAKTGAYTITADVEYDEGKEKETKTVSLNVNCEPKPVAQEPKQPTKQTTQTTSQPTAQAATVTVPAAIQGSFKAVPKQKSYWESYGLYWIIAGYAIGIIILILLIVFFVRKRQ